MIFGLPLLADSTWVGPVAGTVSAVVTAYISFLIVKTQIRGAKGTAEEAKTTAIQADTKATSTQTQINETIRDTASVDALRKANEQLHDRYVDLVVSTSQQLGDSTRALGEAAKALGECERGRAADAIQRSDMQRAMEVALNEHADLKEKYQTLARYVAKKLPPDAREGLDLKLD